MEMRSAQESARESAWESLQCEISNIIPSSLCFVMMSVRANEGLGTGANSMQFIFINWTKYAKKSLRNCAANSVFEIVPSHGYSALGCSPFCSGVRTLSG